MAAGPADVLTQLRAACREVSERSRHVRIEHDRLADYAAFLPLDEMERIWTDTDPFYLMADQQARVAYSLVMNAINFGSGWFPKLRKRDGMSGSYTIASGLKEWFVSSGLPSASRLWSLTAEECATMFGQDLADAEVAELVGLYAQALRELGAWIAGRFGGDFAGPLAAAAGSAAGLVELLLEMPLYRDVEDYHGLRVPFVKRAQITANDLALVLEQPFTDAERLTIFADNLVPHVLRLDGVLWFEPALVDRIEREEPISYASDEEIEIRACAVHACELLVSLLRPRLPSATAGRLDNLLWHRGQGASYKAHPRHRCRSTAY